MAKHEPHHVRLPGDPLPTYEELLQRIEKLEGKPIMLKDLPVSSLMARLENDWQPSPGVLLPPRSIGADLLADHRVAGAIASAGTISEGSGFTLAAHTPGTGVYTVNFSGAFAAAPIVAITPLSPRLATITARTASSFTVELRTDAGAVSDASFLFDAREL